MNRKQSVVLQYKQCANSFSGSYETNVSAKHLQWRIQYTGNSKLWLIPLLISLVLSTPPWTHCPLWLTAKKESKGNLSSCNPRVMPGREGESSDLLVGGRSAQILILTLVINFSGKSSLLMSPVFCCRAVCGCRVLLVSAVHHGAAPRPAG